MKIEKVIVHHSKSADYELPLNWLRLRQYHIEDCGWTDIGYHYGYERIEGSIEVIVGRYMNKVGAHCYKAGMNRRSLGVCVVGDFDKKNPPNWLYEFVAKHVSSLVETFGLSVDEDVLGHCEVDNKKSCPGKLFSMDKLRGLITDRLEAGVK